MSANSTSATGIMSAAAPAKTAKRVAKKTDEVAAPVAAPVATPAPVAAPVKETKPKAKATKTEAAAPVVAAPAPVVATPAPAADATAAAAAVPEEVRLEAEVKSVTARLLAVRETLSELITESKKLEKRAAKLQKAADKRKRRVRAEGEEGKPATVSIFQKPTDISPALCSFLGRPAGSQESRSNVTKAITKYVKDNNLKNKHDINADAKLRALLGLKEGDKLTYFNLQKYLNVHYLKKQVAA